jgi:nonribosomal peptide synthetase DhbF
MKAVDPTARNRASGKPSELPLENGDLLPLSQGQFSIWLAQQLDPGNPGYNIGECIEIQGPVDQAVFQAALREVTAATDALQFRVVDTDDGPRQHRVAEPGWTAPILDFSAESDPTRAAEAWMSADMARPFDLADGRLFRGALIRVRSDRYFWYVVGHHLIIDAAGWRGLLRSVAEAYTALLNGRSYQTVGVGSFVDLLKAENVYRASRHYEADRAYWRAQLKDLPAPMTLSARPPSRPTRFIRSIGETPRPTDLERLGKAHHTGLATVILAAAVSYMHKLTGERDVLLGMPVAARIGARARKIAGFSVNVLPLRVQISRDASFDDVLGQTARRMREALRHQRYRNEELRHDLGLRSVDPEIFRTVVNLVELDDDFTFGNYAIRRNPLGNWMVEDLQIVFYSNRTKLGWRIDFVANPSLYDGEALDEHLRRFLDFLRLLSETPSISLEQLHIEAQPSLRNVELSGRALSDPVSRSSNGHASLQATPRTPTEAALGEIWRASLRTRSVNRTDDFFEVGGHSLLAAQVVSRIRKVFQLELPLRVMFETRTLEGLALRIDDALRDQRNTSHVPPIEPTVVAGPAPLSFAQRRMWMIQSLDPESTAYNISIAIRFVGPLDVEALSAALNHLRFQHESLRSTFRVIEDQPMQDIEPYTPKDMVLVDLSCFGDDAVPEAMRRIESAARAPFDLSDGPAMRTLLLRTGPQEHFLQTTMHHISADQWSIGLIARELADTYNDLRRGRPAKLDPTKIRYRDYALWERRWLHGPEMERHMEFWRSRLKGLQPVELFTDWTRGRRRTSKGALALAMIPAMLLSSLEQLSRREHCTLFMTMFAAFATLLHRRSGQEDIAVGVPVANRGQSAIEGVVGTFVNTIVLRADVSGTITFSDLLARVRAAALDAFAHQDVPFDLLVQELDKTRDPSRPPLVQVLFNLANTPMHGITFDSLVWEPVIPDRGGAQFELSFSIDTQVTRAISVEYNTDLFEKATIERLVAQYLHLLEWVSAEPSVKLGALPLLPPAERHLVLVKWNGTATNDASEALFSRMFEAKVAECPDAPALTFEGTTISYEQLNARANAVARQLHSLGARPGTAVAACIYRSIDLVVALLGIQKSGAAYVPLDLALPSKRLEYMLCDSGATILVTAKNAAGKIVSTEGIRVLDIGASASESVATRLDNPESGATPHDIAYIIYTSGSTGKPKGVAVSNASLANFLLSMKSEPGLSRTDVLAAVTTVTFDIAALELYLPLLVGARVELVAQERAVDGSALSRLLLSSGASVVQATPATWRMLIEAGWKGRPGFRALCGGEALTRDLADALLARADEVWNLYGPTETTVWSTAWRVEGSGPISIGRPIANTQIYVVDRYGEPAPIGVPGEIWIGGKGVALGYHGRAELTKERFVLDHFSACPRSRLYRTGDFGRWGADGRLFHMGRRDHQVKVRGFRIETGEIEAAIKAHPSVRDAVVVAHEVEAGDVRLGAYVVFRDRQKLTASELRKYLRTDLPEYMIPLVVVVLDLIPLTANGKVDRAALPSPFVEAHDDSSAREAPAPGLEQFIARIWQEVLKIDTIGADDNFFELGGHSLLSLHVAALVRQRTGFDMDPRVLFFQSLRQVAAGIILNKPDAQSRLS